MLVGMESLPLELLRLIFEYSDASTVRTLRLVSAPLANLGCEYLIPPHLTVVRWRNDVKRLHSISCHSRLRGSVHSVTFNFSQVDEYNARHTSYFQHWLQDPEERNSVLQEAWLKYYNLEEQGRTLPTFSSQAATVEAAIGRLPNLREVEVTYTKCPYEIDVLKEVFLVRNCRKRDRVQACRDMNVVVAAIRTVRLSGLTLDPLPLETFKVAEDRRHWFECARAGSFASLTRLSLTIDPPATLLPSSRFRAVNGLGHVLQLAPNLRRLDLAFHTYHAPQAKFPLSFGALLGDFVFASLADLKIEGVTCAEDDLCDFLLRHANTLQRLRLGGRGLAKPHEASIGGIHLHTGTFRSLLTRVQAGLKHLQRFHMEGDFQSGEIFANWAERYSFHAVTNDAWEEVTIGNGHAHKRTIDCLELERYMLRGGEYPRLVTPAD